MNINIIPAAGNDIPFITALLLDADLPPDDLETWIDNFLLLSVEGKTVGCIGLEIWGKVGLLRSFVISEEYRSKGLGIKLYNRLMDLAKEMKLTTVLLLVKGASIFFQKNGFKFIDRNEVPESVKKSIQFKLEECREYDVMKLAIN